jgi:hypothetical protein
LAEVYQCIVFSNLFASSDAKEVHLYAEALKQGFALVQSSGLLTNNFIIINYASLSVYQSFKIDLMLNFVIF